MPGPLADPSRLVPTATLSSRGPEGDPPPIPPWVTLGKAGRKWWLWAWRTPQACAWGKNVGMESLIARRASLEDDLDALERAQSDVVEMSELLDLLEQGESIRWLFQRLVSMATPRLAIQKEMREIDDRLGLTPKGLAALKWVIIDDPEAVAEAAAAAEAAQAEAEEDRRMKERRERVASGDA